MMQKEQRSLDPHGANIPDDYPKPGALRERFVTEGKFTYFARLDDFIELNMNGFGKMKLSVVPEGVIYSTYAYFKQQDRFPTYDKFFDSCLMHTKEADIDMKPRWRRFYDACQKHAIDTKTPPCLPPAFTAAKSAPGSRILSDKEVEEEFWKIEKYKLTPHGSKIMERIGDPHNCYRTQMQEIPVTNKGLFELYMLAYPKSNPNINPMEPSFKNMTAHASYLEALTSSQSARQGSTDCKDQAHSDQKAKSPPALDA